MRQFIDFHKFQTFRLRIQFKRQTYLRWLPLNLMNRFIEINGRYWQKTNKKNDLHRLRIRWRINYIFSMFTFISVTRLIIVSTVDVRNKYKITPFRFRVIMLKTVVVTYYFARSFYSFSDSRKSNVIIDKNIISRC